MEGGRRLGKHKIYEFDDFEVDSDELNIIEGFKEIENEE